MEWTDEDFANLSWHDNHVHSLRIEKDNSDHGTGILILDLDFIAEWIRASGSGQPLRFRVVPSTLTFFEVSGLRIEIDWAAATAGTSPFSLGEIARKKLEYPNGHSSWAWTIIVNWPTGSITFESPRFQQVSRGSVIEVGDPCLSPDQRPAV